MNQFELNPALAALIQRRQVARNPRFREQIQLLSQQLGRTSESFSRDALREIVKVVEWLPAALPAIQLPTPIQHAGADRLAGVSGSRMISSAITYKDKRLKVYEGLYHEIKNELPQDRKVVLADLTEWITSRVA